MIRLLIYKLLFFESELSVTVQTIVKTDEI